MIKSNYSYHYRTKICPKWYLGLNRSYAYYHANLHGFTSFKKEYNLLNLDLFLFGFNIIFDYWNLRD